jgi:NIPSNAP protein
MLFELRTYTIRPGRLPAYVSDFERRGLPIITRYAELIAYWVAEVGALNQVVHVWAYRDAAHRAEQRARLYSDPDWTEGYLPTALDDVQHQESRLLTAAAFSPLQ